MYGFVWFWLNTTITCSKQWKLPKIKKCKSHMPTFPACCRNYDTASLRMYLFLYIWTSKDSFDLEVWESKQHHCHESHHFYTNSTVKPIAVSRITPTAARAYCINSRGVALHVMVMVMLWPEQLLPVVLLVVSIDISAIRMLIPSGRGATHHSPSAKRYHPTSFRFIYNP